MKKDSLGYLLLLAAALILFFCFWYVYSINDAVTMVGIFLASILTVKGILILIFGHGYD